MRKYWHIVLLTIEELLSYRFNFITARIRSVVSVVALIIFWRAIYGENAQLFGYNAGQIATYLFLVVLIKGLVFSSRSADLANLIRSGELNRMLAKPWNLMGYWLSRDAADKIINLLSAFFEVLILIKLFNITIHLSSQISVYLSFGLFVLLANFLYFFVSMILSVTGLWTEDVWATRWLFGVIFLDFMSGSLFPIDVLPKTLVTIFNYTPFPYLVYYPIKIWNEQISAGDIQKVFIITCFWLVISYLVYRWLWQKGIKKFGAYGG